MAKPKQDVIVKVFMNSTTLIDVWADDLVSSEILSIEGIVQVYVRGTLPWMIEVDPRYDINEVVTELEMLLFAKIPDAFSDETDPD